MNGTNSSTKHYDTVVIGSSAARTSLRHSSRQTRQKDCGVERSITLGGLRAANIFAIADFSFQILAFL